jgi:hypothetical protein
VVQHAVRELPRAAAAVIDHQQAMSHTVSGELQHLFRLQPHRHNAGSSILASYQPPDNFRFSQPYFFAATSMQ